MGPDLPKPPVLASKRRFLRKKYIIIYLLILITIPISFYFVKQTRILSPKSPQLVQKEEINQSLIIKRVDPKAGTGEFVILEGEIVQENLPQPDQQVVIDGSYDQTSKKVVVKTSDILSYAPTHHIPVQPSEGIWLKIKMVSDDGGDYQTALQLYPKEGETIIPFQVNIPYMTNFTLSIYDREDQLLVSEKIKI